MEAFSIAIGLVVMYFLLALTFGWIRVRSYIHPFGVLAIYQLGFGLE